MPKDKRKPVKIIGIDAGNTILNTWANELNRNTLLTLSRSLGMFDTPTAVLIRVGHKQHKATVKAEVKNDLQEEKAKQLAMDDAQKLFSILQSNQSLDDLVLSYTAPEGTSIKDKKVEESGLFSLSINSNYVSNMGACQDAMFKAFQMDLNEVAGPFEGDVAHYLIQIVERDEADIEKLKNDPKVRTETLKKLVQAKKNEVFTDWYNSTRKQITVTDHRS